MRCVRVVVLGGLVASACQPPSPGLRLELSAGQAQRCPSTDCAEIGLACRTWISIRIIDPADPISPFLSQCQEVPQNRKKDLCAVALVDLATTPLPLRDLEVQVALFPESAVTIDPISGEAQCPTDVQYDAINGFPVASGPTPALGGRTYYREGDSEIVVTLGCTDLGSVNEETCLGQATVAVRATVEDFDLRLSVDGGEASRLSVGVGEPKPANNAFVLNPDDVTPLERTVTAPPAWAADVQALFTSTACLAVLDDIPQSTTSLSCQRASVVTDELTFTGNPSRGEPSGVRLKKSSLDQILAALGLLQFPAQGLTIGIVLDANGNPVANQVVTAAAASVQYLSADRTSLVPTATSASAIFISTDAPFGTTFTTSSGPIATASALGGLVDGKVTIAILRFTDPIVGGGT